MNRLAVCITGGGFSNKGAEAMVLTVVDAICRRLPDVNIYIHVHQRDFEQARDNGLLPVKKGQPTSMISRLASKIRTASMYYKCRAFIDVGGYQFGDPWGAQLAERKTRSLRHCDRFGNLIFFMPQAWGPFSTARISKAVHSIIDDCTLAFVRDKTSLQAVEHIVGKNHSKVRFAHDIAWNFRGADLSVGRQLIQDGGLLKRDNSITIGITPNLRVYEKFEGAKQENQYIKFLRDIIQHLCSAHSAQIILLGHEIRQDNSKVKDDRTLCNYLLSSLDRSLPVIHLDRVLTAAQVKSVIGNCDLLLSSRYHALIAGLSQGIPVVAIGWSHKYDELMNDVGLDSYVIRVENGVEKATSHLDEILSRMPDVWRIVAGKTTAMKQSGQQALDEVIDLISKKRISAPV